MTWREQIVVKILLLIAKIVDEGPWRDDLKNLANHISVTAASAARNQERNPE